MTTPSHDTPMTPSEQLKPCQKPYRVWEINEANEEIADLRAKLAGAEKERDEARALNPVWHYSQRQEQFLTDDERDSNGEFGPEWQPVIAKTELEWLRQTRGRTEKSIRSFRHARSLPSLDKLANYYRERVLEQDKWLAAAQLRLRVTRDALGEIIESAFRLLIEGLLHETVAERRMDLRVAIAKGSAALASTSTTDLQSAIDGASRALDFITRCRDSRAIVIKTARAALAQLARFVTPGMPGVAPHPPSE